MTSLPLNWAVAPLGAVVSHLRTGPFGSAVHKHEYVLDGVPLINPMHINNGAITPSAGMAVSAAKAADLSEFRLAEGDVVIARRGTMGRCATVSAEQAGWLIGTGSMALTPGSAVGPDYLQLFLSSPEVVEVLSANAVGTTMANLNQAVLLGLKIPLPPRSEQYRIVAKLDALTARTARARAELNKVNALGPRYQVALLRAAMLGELTAAWRIELPDAEPAARLVARTPAPSQGRGGREATTEVIDGQAALSVNKPNRELPPGWSWTPLLRVTRQETGHTPSRNVKSYWDGGVPWIGIRDAGAHHGAIIHETLQTISDDGLENSSARLLPEGTVCLSRTASVGYVTIMGRKMATSQDFATWTCSEALAPKFLMYALMAEGDDIRAFGKGSTHTTIYFPEIRALHIALPPLDEQLEIVRKIEAGLADIGRMTAEASAAHRLLDRLDESILVKAFRGELVPQDPADEPARALLARIQAEREDAPTARRGRRPKAA